MSKKARVSSPYSDGWRAARSGQSRNTNPYPSSATEDRNEWFRGYDTYLRAALIDT
jgi:hypothetical protein